MRALVRTEPAPRSDRLSFPPGDEMETRRANASAPGSHCKRCSSEPGETASHISRGPVWHATHNLVDVGNCGVSLACRQRCGREAFSWLGRRRIRRKRVCNQRLASRNATRRNQSGSSSERA